MNTCPLRLCQSLLCYCLRTACRIAKLCQSSPGSTGLSLQRLQAFSCLMQTGIKLCSELLPSILQATTQSGAGLCQSPLCGFAYIRGLTAENRHLCLCLFTCF